ncbi:hypothetical protein AA12717_0551 [Gluconacetobacter sacchari DSM 12717]|uniref:Uncharacterized protein n=1 Tax=Gluconacetobacter sacchari DSM 12717 TaxID=1307940 RepID=A0ABQ0P3H9_9PROT|nr:hypothetical protein AA12717_0551 [Gluconacetobacter sacchari DSM 12717]
MRRRLVSRQGADGHETLPGMNIAAVTMGMQRAAITPGQDRQRRRRMVEKWRPGARCRREGT